ncbi:bifunctional protein-serine/threonine kinase/phosphatase [Aquincola tertiaricarbonis]|uniref:bifunctional protein-serine/threonine kinase/phosphatase n=1 Tax=Aquincola tertiaricarbonis TaxID=391953 RepID=UPI000614DA6E|nr:bifunctional protein-serine/threonine kinase/phosphatase [Aquincola tertiaricarbonis]
MSFDVDIGLASQTGPRRINEDFAGVRRGDPLGLIAVMADGVSTGGGGQEAAQTVVRGLLADYFDAPDTWETTVVLDRLIQAHSQWLADHNRRRQNLSEQAGEPRTALTTVTALVVHGHGFTIAHAGDSRAAQLVDGELVQLTTDHVFGNVHQRNRLTRALGLDDMVRLDFVQGEVRVGDCFVLTTDGMHGLLPARRMAHLMREAPDAQAAADTLVRAALEAGGTDNASAIVLRIRGLDTGRLEDALLRGRRLDPPPPLKVGDVLDGLTITARVADTGVHRLYQARTADRRLVAVKTLHESRASDPEERAMLAHEAWLGLRVGESGAPGFVQVHEVAAPSALYTVFDWHGGHTLEQLLAQRTRFGVADVVQAGIAIGRALGRLHRLGVVHRDVKPGNLHRGDDGHWRLLDLGVAISGREPAVQRQLHAGTPSYMNPEQWDGAAADAGSDLFALGVTLYQWLGGRLPYGEIEPWQAGRYRRDPRALSRLRPEVPMWLDHLVLKAVARDPRQRFETAEELVLALERGAARSAGGGSHLGAPPATPLALRDPAALWMAAFWISALFNIALVAWLLFLPR